MSLLIFKKGIVAVQSIVTFIKRLTRMCLQSLHRRFIDWTKPDTTSSLMMGTLTDLARSKSELVAENALLRKPLIIILRQVKRPACTRTDRMLLVLLARMARTWKQAHITRSSRDAPAVASPGLQALLEIQVQSSFCQTKGSSRDSSVDSGNGNAESASSELNASVANCSS
jgi:hypothetical protein